MIVHVRRFRRMRLTERLCTVLRIQLEIAGSPPSGGDFQRRTNASCTTSSARCRSRQMPKLSRTSPGVSRSIQWVSARSVIGRPGPAMRATGSSACGVEGSFESSVIGTRFCRLRRRCERRIAADADSLSCQTGDGVCADADHSSSAPKRSASGVIMRDLASNFGSTSRICADSIVPGNGLSVGPRRGSAAGSSLLHQRLGPSTRPRGSAAESTPPS